MPVAPSSPLASRPDGLKALVIWHAGWSLAAGLVAAGALSGLLFTTAVRGFLAVSLVIMILPGIAGLMLWRRDGWNERAMVLAAWGLATLAASALTGGVTGSLAGSILMPIAAGIALGEPRLAQSGTVVTVLAVLVGLISAFLGGSGRTEPVLAAVVAVMAAGAIGAAMRAAWSYRERDMKVATGAAGRVEALLTGQPGLTVVLDPQGAVLAAYGSPPPAFPVEGLYDRALTAGVHPNDRAAVTQALTRARAGQATQVMFAPVSALDRRVVLFVRRLEESENPRLIAQAFDGTAQFAREVGLEAARVEAEASNAGKSRFLANMSHELRTPLNAVIGFSDIMRQRLFGPLPDRYAEYADSIHEAGGHLLDLINDVLDVSKIEADRYELSLERFDARDVVSAAIALVRLSANDKGVELTGILPPNPSPVDADRRALKQITLNLLSNAIKFTPATGSVTVTMEAIGPYLEIVVADTGVGIAPEDLKRLGRPFEQAGAADQKAQGTGLGLSLVRSLAELHGGRMSIESTLGEGAAVTVRLPVIARAETPTTDGAEIIPFQPG